MSFRNLAFQFRVQKSCIAEDIRFMLPVVCGALHGEINLPGTKRRTFFSSKLTMKIGNREEWKEVESSFGGHNLPSTAQHTTEEGSTLAKKIITEETSMVIL